MIEEVARYSGLELKARQVVEGFITGLHRSPFHGFSVEFAEHRQYNAGESTHDIDWKLYGRTDRLYVKRYEEETNLRCQLMVDQSRSMMFPVENMGNFENPNKLTFAVMGAAIIVELLQRQRDAFGLTLMSDGVDEETICRSSGVHKHYVYGLLEEALKQPVKGDKEERRTSIAETLHLTAERLHRRSMVVIFTDAFLDGGEWEELMEALRHLRHCKHEVLLFHTYEETLEMALEFESRPTEFIDLESKRHLKVNPAEVAIRYKEEMERRRATLKENAVKYGIDYVAVPVEQGFEQIMIPYLLKRGRAY